MSHVFAYSLKGRRPVMWAGLGVAGGLLVIAAVAGAPWYIWAIWGGPAVAMVWAVLTNPVSGCRITPEVFIWHSGGTETAVRMDQISVVQLTSWADGPDTCRILLTNGETLSPPAICLPSGPVLNPGEIRFDPRRRRPGMSMNAYTGPPRPDELAGTHALH